MIGHNPQDRRPVSEVKLKHCTRICGKNEKVEKKTKYRTSDSRSSSTIKGHTKAGVVQYCVWIVLLRGTLKVYQLLPHAALQATSKVLASCSHFMTPASHASASRFILSATRPPCFSSHDPSFRVARHFFTASCA